MIYALIGKTGVGKTTISKEVSKLLDIPIIVTYTTRPKREGEEDKIDYNFVDNSYFEEHKKDFIDIREYTVANGETWLYGIKKSDIKKHKRYLIVVDTEGYKNLSKYYKVTPIIIDANDSVIIDRLKERGDNELEITRRLKDDNDKMDKFMNEIALGTNAYMIDNTIPQICFAPLKIQKIIESEKMQKENIVMHMIIPFVFLMLCYMCMCLNK